MQESRLVNGGLRKKYHPSIVASVLNHAHGWKNQQEISVNSGSTLAAFISAGDGKSKDLISYDRNDK